MKNKVLVLGHKGMLGHMVVKYLQDNKVDVVTVKTRWPVSQIEINNFEGDYIINCIGAVPQRNKDFNINWQLPIWLDLHAPCKVIHPGTDCEMEVDDEYGISKNVAADYIRNLSRQTKSIKTSIIGPELDGNASLLEWFLSQEGEVFGYTKAIWNGNTTLEWAKQCYQLMNEWNGIGKEIIISSTSVSKFELLSTIKRVFNKDIDIKQKELGSNKCLEGIIYTGTIEEQLKELKEYYYED
jgi:dTDP-4-dehydrorhamnose reductase